MKRQIEWTTGNGQKAVVTVSVDSIDATVDGQDVGYGSPVAVSHPIAVAKIGKLGLTQEHLDAVTAAIAEVEQSDEGQAARRERERVDRELKEYYAGHDRVMRAMNP